MKVVSPQTIIPALERLFAQLHPLIVSHWGDRNVATLKPDGSWVTIMDKMIEARLRDLFVELLPGAYFLGEESYDSAIGSESALLDHELLIVVDPIDGTRNYVEGHPSFGTLIGIYRQSDGRFYPHLGAVYRPISGKARGPGDLGRITFNDGDELGIHALIGSSEADLIIENVPFLRESHSASNQPRVVASARAHQFTAPLTLVKNDVSIVDLMLPITGDAEATISRSRFWDIGGPLVLATSLGLKVYDLRTRQEIQNLGLEHFILEGEQKWELRDYLVFSSAEIFDRIRTG